MWKQFTLVRVGNTVDRDFETLRAEFEAEVSDLNASAALDWRTTRYTDREFWNCYPVVPDKAEMNCRRESPGTVRPRRP